MNSLSQSQAELQARATEDLATFGGVNIPHIKRQVAELLEYVGREGIFSQYTKHNISHIDGMLTIVDWLIPAATSEKLSPGDWLMIVLSTYFHDLGLLVTEEEFRNRQTSRFPQYVTESLLTSDDAGRDYRGKVDRLDPDARERFLYQEFVRAYHAKRIRSWIETPDSMELGAATSVAAEIKTLLQPLPENFRSHLATVCESHHLDDLDDIDKYPTIQPYGNGDSERVNVQYAAIILRTADLLQITNDRTPSIAYRILNPSDPISQQEWAKQMAVSAIVAQAGRDDDGNVDLNAPRSVVEVHANFNHEGGFFGLTQYLSYAEQQLNQSNKWAEESRRRHGSTFEFPWRKIDQTKVKTNGFLKEQFEFELDQTRILDLLTGHTLYNNSQVVVRELTQNAIDAVRLQYHSKPGKTSMENGTVQVNWDSANRILEVLDNGTGMTQDVVKANFLKVGASRYQEKRFREQYPEFSPISRFGIGVLSAFMVADAVEVITVSEYEEKARRISLRSVHGKYLIRLLDKTTDPEVQSIGPHGTLIRLTIRASSQIGDIVGLVRRWFVLPNCTLTVCIDGGQPQSIGYRSLTDALLDIVDTGEKEDISGKSFKVEVEEREMEGVTVAFAKRWSPYFRHWEFVQLEDKKRRLPDSSFMETDSPMLGVCIEGVRVNSGTPGFEGPSLYAIANASGRSAPRTNVARSDLEDTSEYRIMLRSIYDAYLAHIEDEIRSMMTDRGYSLTGAVSEGQYLLFPFLNTRPPDRLSSISIYAERLRVHPINLLETSEGRELLSLKQLDSYDTIRSVDDELVNRAEGLIRYLPAATSLRELIHNVPSLDVDLPEGPILVSGIGMSMQADMFMREWEVSEIIGDPNRPRLDLIWRKIGEKSLWARPLRDFRSSAGRLFSSIDRVDLRIGRSQSAIKELAIPSDGVGVQGLSGFSSVSTQGSTYLIPGASWTSILEFVTGTRKVAEAEDDLLILTAWLYEIRTLLANLAETTSDSSSSLKDRIGHVIQSMAPTRKLDLATLLSLVNELHLLDFNTTAWRRHESIGG